jgi:hypothetical protein
MIIPCTVDPSWAPQLLVRKEGALLIRPEGRMQPRQRVSSTIYGSTGVLAASRGTIALNGRTVHDVVAPDPGKDWPAVRELPPSCRATGWMESIGSQHRSDPRSVTWNNKATPDFLESPRGQWLMRGSSTSITPRALMLCNGIPEPCLVGGSIKAASFQCPGRTTFSLGRTLRMLNDD